MPDLTGLGSLFEFGTELMKRIWPDATEADRAKQTMFLAEMESAHRERMEQIKANAAQAQSSSLFVAGPRPAVMWTCAAAFAVNFLIYPVWVWIATAKGWPTPPAPPLSDNLWELTAGTLGLAGMRSWEKGKGVASK